MKTRNTLMVIGTTAALFLGALLLVILLGRGLQALRQAQSSEEARQEFIGRWQPPSELSADLVFPRDVGGRRAGATETNSVHREPDFELPGLQTTYVRPGRPDVTVFVGRAGEAEAEAVFQRARELHAAREGSKALTEVPGRLRLTRERPPETLELWSLHGWLLLYRAPGELEAEFIRLHLLGIGKKAPG